MRINENATHIDETQRPRFVTQKILCLETMFFDSNRYAANSCYLIKHSSVEGNLWRTE